LLDVHSDDIKSRHRVPDASATGTTEKIKQPRRPPERLDYIASGLLPDAIRVSLFDTTVNVAILGFMALAPPVFPLYSLLAIGKPVFALFNCG